MSEAYQPRQFPRNREYPGYQFYCALQHRDGNSESGFCFAVLCVIDWLKQRLQKTGVIPKEISRLPERQSAHVICLSDLESFTINSGFSAYAVSLPEHGIWTLRLKEPDSDTNTRKAVPGRFFATNVGIRIMNDKQVELGIRIDVTDPEGVPEIEFAFRPQLLRYLYEAQEITLSQTITLPYEKAVPVENDEQFKALRSVLDNGEGTLPLIIITQCIRLPKEEPMPLMSKIQFPSSLNAPPAGLFSNAFPAAPVIEHYFPFDADEIAAHNFGYAITFRITEKMHGQLAGKLRKDYLPGDILFAEPKRFGGNVRVIGKDEKEASQQIWQRSHCYSKGRKYFFGNVQYEYDARNIENRELIERIRTAGDMENEEKLAVLNRKIDELQEENEKRVRKISELRDQIQAEYDRGVENERQRNLELIEDHDTLERELQAIKARNLQLEQENQTARAQQAALRAIRIQPDMPQTNEDVVNWFIQVYGDRIAFTERGFKTACRCDIKAEGLWYYLYHMATALYEIHHANLPEAEKEFLHATGIEAAMSEGSQSRKDNKIMNLRNDTYQGKELSMEPHVKLLPQKAGAAHQRIYYCYDHELDLIIIGSVGDHLKTAGTMHLN